MRSVFLWALNRERILPILDDQVVVCAEALACVYWLSITFEKAPCEPKNIYFVSCLMKYFNGLFYLKAMINLSLRKPDLTATHSFNERTRETASDTQSEVTI